MTTNKINPPLYYSSTTNNNNDDDDEIFSDEKIQRYDADTIKQRYGGNWRNYASNVRDIKQADGSIVREYIIEDPNLINEIKPSIDSTSSTTSSDNEQQQQSSKHKFAQIKAKFEQRSLNNVMASPSSSSVASSHTTTNTRRSSNNKPNDYRINSTIPTPPITAPPPPAPPPPPISTTNSNSHPSRSVSNSSFQRLNSADDADEEVQRIHRQGVELRQHQTASTPMSSISETNQQQTSQVQYEVVDEDGNPMAIDDVQNLIKMSGVTAREVPQADGTIVREYVIDDPHVLSKLQSQQGQGQPQSSHEHIPPPPPRIPLKQSALFRQQQPLATEYDPPPINIQQIRTLEPQRRYEFITSSGKRIEFMITNLGAEQTDVHELANTINTRLRTSSSTTTNPYPPPPQQQQQPFTHPKQWHPAVDLTHREPRQRTGSDNQPTYGFQQMPTDSDRPVSYGTLNQGTYPQQSQQFDPIFAEPIIDWSIVRQQDPHGQIDPQFIRQYITQNHPSEGLQTSAQFLPEQQQQPQAQMSRSMYSPSRNNQPQPQAQTPIYYQQSMAYPYQGQQQHGVRINQDYNYNQAPISDGHTRI